MFRNHAMFVILMMVLESYSISVQHQTSDDLDVAVVPGGPVIFFVDVSAGPNHGGPGNLGVPIAIFGKGFGTTRGTSTVTIDGVEVAKYVLWDKTMLTTLSYI